MKPWRGFRGHRGRGEHGKPRAGAVIRQIVRQAMNKDIAEGMPTPSRSASSILEV